MKTISYKLKDLDQKEKKVTLKLGYVGENEHVQIRIDCSEIWENYPNAVASLAVEPPEGSKYPAIVTREGNVVCWTVKDSDVVHDGDGRIQLTFTEGSEIQKTVICRTKVDESIVGSGTAPDPIADFVSEANEALAELEAAEVHGPVIGEDGYWYTWSKDAGEYVKTDTKAQGEDGPQGPAGKDGADGAPGQDGYTPVKGTDYWTQQDQADIVAAAALETVSAVIDDTAGDGDTNKTWSADKIADVTGQLLNAIQGKVSSQEMETCEKILVPGSKNLWNPQTMENGFVGTNGAVSSSDSYVYNFIDVMPGDEVYCSVAGTARNMRFICSYDENDDAQSTKGSGTDTNGFTVPDGIVKLAISVVSSIKDDVMILLNDSAVPGSYIAYKDPYYVYVATDAFMQNINAMTESYFQNKYMETVPKNILNPSDPDCVTKKLIVYSTGALSDNNDYYTTGFMPVIPGKTYTFWTSGLSPKGARAIAAYGSGRGVVSASGVNDGTATTYSYTVPNGIAYIRISFPYRTNDTTFQPSGNMVIASLMPESFMAYSDADEYIFKEEFIPEVDNLHVYLPKEICVGVGRTIELYNELVCLEANKYHLRYVCSKGIQYERKFSITGATAGEYPLQLQIYDDNMKMVWTGNSTVKVVENNIASELKVLPIGDSLTNLKPWLNEVQSLSDSKILYIGTRGRSDQTIRCEGRSGFTAADYSANTSYTFDSNYQGNPNVDGSVNPFWDGSKFSLAYYNTQQSATVGTADAVQLFLGTNDVFGGFTAEESAQHIKALVDAIRADDATIPIFVCHTIYRSNQSGYYSSGGQGFTAASGWAFDSDMKIMKFQIALANALKSYTNLYIIPLSVCMDREYDYGVNAESVNPRLSTVTENIPTESVHPQEPGYLQIADVMYSSYIAHLA